MDEMRDPTRDESTSTDTAGASSLADEPLPGDDGAGSTGWSGDAGGESTSGRGREWMAQLQAMIDDIATQAAPIARQVASKAAELAAIAAEKAGPAAQRAAEVTADASAKFAERAHQAAADLRREAEAAGEPGGGSPVWSPAGDASGVGTGDREPGGPSA